MAGTIGQYQQGAFATPVNGTTADASVVLSNDNTIRSKHNSHDNDPTIHVQSSVLASRPAAATAQRIWVTSDGLRAYIDTGAAWSEFDYLCKTAGGTVTGALTSVGGIALTGASGIAVGASKGALDYTTGGVRVISYGPDAATNGLFYFVSARSDGTNAIVPITTSVTGAITFAAGITISAGGAAVTGNSAIAGLLYAKADLATYSEPSAQIRALGLTDTNKQTVMGINTTANVGFIQATQFGTASLPLQIQPNGGATSVGGSFRLTTVAGSPGDASLTKLATSGFQIQGATGSSYDFVLADPTGVTAIIKVPTGTSNVSFAASVTIASGLSLTSGDVTIADTKALKSTSFTLIDVAGSTGSQGVAIGGGYAGTANTYIRGTNSVPGAGANGCIVIDTSTNRLIYYSGGSRYYIAGTSF